MGLFSRNLAIPTSEEALPGRAESMPVPSAHFVNGQPLVGPFPSGFQQIQFGMGCFWGAERKFLGTAGRLYNRSRLRRRSLTQPNL